jgi:hypothetical protein
MPKAESYNDLIFEVGDMARERLANRPTAPRSIDRVLKAEESLLQRQQELQELEGQMNDEDAAHQDYVAQCEAEKAENNELVAKFKRAVDVVEHKIRDLRKALSKGRSEQRYGAKDIKLVEKRMDEWVQAGADPSKIETAKQNLKKLRLRQMRVTKEVEELERQVNQIFDVPDDQPGARGIHAHKRNMDIEDELETRKDEFETQMQEIDEAIAAKEEELKAAEEYLDQAVFLLGEECYAQRIADPALAAFYPRLDRAE